MSEEIRESESKDKPIKMTNAEKPFQSESAAKSVFQRQNYNPDTNWIGPYGGGYAIFGDGDTITPEEEEYFVVIFSAKSAPHEENDVILSVNGETLIMAREQEVVVPRRFLEAADHATYPRFTQMPNQPRKVAARIKTYPYTRLRQATADDFMRQKQAGTKTTREAIQKYGFDYKPDDIAA